MNTFVLLPSCQCSQEDKNVYYILTDDHPYGSKLFPAGSICYLKEQTLMRYLRMEFTRFWRFVMEDDGSVATMDVESLLPLEDQVAPFLLAVSSARERLSSFLDRHVLDAAMRARVGQHVLVKLSHQTFPGVLRYIGKLHKSPLPSGICPIFFGVELESHGEGRGHCDGSYNGTEYFKCKPGCGIFLPFNKLQFLPVPENSALKETEKSDGVEVMPVKVGDALAFYLDEALTRGIAMDVYKEGSTWMVKVCPEEEASVDDFRIIPMDSVVKEELLSAAVELETDLGVLSQEQPKHKRKQSVVEKGARPSSLDINSVVEINLEKGTSVTGTIRWIGCLPNSLEKVAGVELDEEKGFSDGEVQGVRYFTCPPKRGLFVRLDSCQPDMRFQAEHHTHWEPPETRFPGEGVGTYMAIHHCLFDRFVLLWDLRVKRAEKEGVLMGGFMPHLHLARGLDTPAVTRNLPPLRDEMAVKVLSGPMRGIQGHCNSCYMDAALFSLFSCTSVLDSMLYKPASPPEVHVQKILRDKIVNPLRQNGFVAARSVMDLRYHLTEKGQCSSFATSEKDPEEFLNLIMHHIFGIEPLLKLQSGRLTEQECYCYQIFMDKQEELVVPNVQQLVEHSFLSSDLKLVEIPSCLILQMPRFGKEYKMFNKIIPSLELDITDLLLDSPRECFVCGAAATQECSACFKDRMFADTGLKQYCDSCCKQAHSHYQRKGHQTTELRVPQEFHRQSHLGHGRVPREKLELFAVLCIETSHYVTFVKYGPDKENWMFFDSMADRHGDENGYNIPTVTLCPEVAKYLEMPVAALAMERPREMEGVAKRLFCDAYMYMYQSKRMALYK